MKKNDLWDPKFYKKNSSGQYNHAMASLKNMKISQNGTVLDIGCGDGRITKEISDLVSEGNVLGIDVSDNMIREASFLFKDVKNLKFKCFDISKEILDEKFDLVTSFSAFHWIEDQTQALKNIHSILNPKGRVLILASALYKSPVSEFINNHEWTKYNLKKNKNYFPTTVEGFEKLFKETGFKNYSAQLIVEERNFASEDELINNLMAWMPHAVGFEREKALIFTKELAKAVYPINNGKVPGALVKAFAEI